VVWADRHRSRCFAGSARSAVLKLAPAISPEEDLVRRARGSARRRRCGRCGRGDWFEPPDIPDRMYAGDPGLPYYCPSSRGRRPPGVGHEAALWRQGIQAGSFRGMGD
jgi:hypothetical protein